MRGNSHGINVLADDLSFSGREIEKDTNRPGIKMAEGQKNLSPFKLPLESPCWQMILLGRRRFR